MKIALKNKLDESSMILVVLLGVISGTVLSNSLYHVNPTLVQPFLIDQYYSGMSMVYSYKKLLLCVVPQRIFQTMVAVAVMTLCPGAGIYYGFLYLLSLIWGLLASLEVIHLGVEGLVLASVCVIPHGLLYGLMIYIGWYNRMNVDRKKYYVIGLIFLAALFAEVVAEPQLMRWIHIS